jgi:cell division transport system ATP-binding protein
MIEFLKVSKQFSRNTYAVRDVSLLIKQGELVFLAGPSGAGKSTLLKMIAAIERPTSGKLTVSGNNISLIKSGGLPYLRRNLGLIFQQQKLLQDRSLLANVMLPLLVTGTTHQDAEKRARAALDKVGLLDKATLDPQELSGGEQQRVAIARAIVNRPKIILADEPTANLDRENADKVLAALKSFHGVGVTCVIATHDEQYLKGPNRIVYLDHGRLVNRWHNSSETSAEALQ